MIIGAVRVCMGVWALVLGACSTVSSVEPFGGPPRPVLAAEWEGTWLHQDHPVVVRVVDAQQGRLEVAWVEDKGGALRLESYQVALRGLGDWTFSNATEDGHPGRYFWAALRKERGQFILWTPDAERCARLVRDGVIPGTVAEDGDVILAALTPEQTLQVVSQEQGGCLDWSQPIVFFRLGH